MRSVGATISLYRRIAFLSLLVSLAFFAGADAGTTAQSSGTRHQVDLLKRQQTEKPFAFGIYLENDTDMLYRLSVFRTVVLDTTHFSADQLYWLRKTGTRIYSYTHIGSIENGTDEYNQFKQLRLKKKVPHSGERYYIDPLHKGWRTHLIQQMEVERQKGIAGFYLVDGRAHHVAGRKKKRRVAKGQLSILQRIHDDFPKQRVILENSLSLLDSKPFGAKNVQKKVRYYYDGIAATQMNYRPVYKAADNGRDTYKPAGTSKKRNRTTQKLQQHRSLGKAVYTIDYTQSKKQKNKAEDRAYNNGFVSFVGTRYLDNVLWYGGVTSSVATRPFSNTSIWNTPISKKAAVDKDSARMVDTLRNGISRNRIFVNVDEWTAPIYYTDATMQKNKVHCRNCAGGFGENMAVPDYAVADNTLDGLLSVVNVDTGYAYDMFKAGKGATGEWGTQSGFKFSMTGSGVQRVHPTSSATRGAGFPLYAGIIRRDEILQGVIPHALVIAIDYPAADYFVRPASHEDGRSYEPYGIPEGARIRIRPDVDVYSLGLSRTGTIIAKALQDYGAFIADNADGIAVYAEGRYAKEVGWEDAVTGGQLIDSEVITKVPFDTLEIMKLGKKYWY